MYFQLKSIQEAQIPALQHKKTAGDIA